jgi:hypothetical protein
MEVVFEDRFLPSCPEWLIEKDDRKKKNIMIDQKNDKQKDFKKDFEEKNIRTGQTHANT